MQYLTVCVRPPSVGGLELEPMQVTLVRLQGVRLAMLQSTLS